MDKELRKKLIWGISIALSVISSVYLIAEKAPIGIILFMNLIFLGCGLPLPKLFELREKEKEMLKNPPQAKYMVYFENDKKYTAELYKRGKLATSGLKVKPIYDVNISDHDAELVYTGVSVGGVHTGGFHVNPAYRSIDSFAKSGKYELQVTIIGDSIPKSIKTIHLSKEVLQEAKKDRFIRQFLTKDNTLELKYDSAEAKMTASEKEQFNSLVKNNMHTVAWALYKNKAFANQLTKGDCQQVLKWIGGEDIDRI